jgi:tetratricopeptide (TPR) repeat protein
MRFTTAFRLLCLLLFAGVPAYAQEMSTPEPSPEQVVSLPPANLTELPPAVRLEGLTAIHQDFNRCSAAALSMQLSYFEVGDYHTTIAALNPHTEDVAVRLDEMTTYARSQGLGAIDRVGGTLDLLKALTANGFPVLVEMVYYDGDDYNRDWMAHNRVIVGYDDATQNFYAYDSLLGNGEDGRGRPIPYADFDGRWKPFNRDYLVLYRPEEEEKVRAILGDHWDATYSAEFALSQAEAEIAAGGYDSFTMFNKGSSLVLLGRYEEAAAAFDEARNRGLPWRFLWYQYGPFEAYLQVGRNEDVITLARAVVDSTPGVEEAYYYAALAYRAQGDLIRAKANLEVAVLRNSSFAAAASALAEVASTTG